MSGYRVLGTALSACINTFSLHNNRKVRCYSYSHFTDEETEAKEVKSLGQSQLING